MTTPISASRTTVTLTSGRQMPLIGFGTYQLQGSDGRRAIEWALELGMRHFDTATSYGNEADLGLAIAQSGPARDDLFLTSKLPLGRVGDERRTIEETLKALRVDHLDLWLMHWPTEDDQLVPAWEAMLALRDEGLVRDVGVSNFSPEQIDRVSSTGATPVANQIRWNPFLYDAQLARAHQERSVLLCGYTPFRRARLDDPVLLEIAAEAEATPTQVILRWHLNRGWGVLFRSSRLERIRENLGLDEVRLDEHQLVRLERRAGMYTFE